MSLINKLGGYDSVLLKFVPDFERLRLQSLAILLIIPTFTGFFAMFLMLDSYKNSGLSTGIIILISLIWAFFIFLMDRALFIFPKKKSDSQKKKYILFIARFTISLIIGFTISHSLLVYMNKGLIDKDIQENIQLKIDNKTKNENTQIINNTNLINIDKKEVRELENEIKKIHEFLKAEENGDKTNILIDGINYPTSGKPNSDNKDKNRNTNSMNILLNKKEEHLKTINKRIETSESELKTQNNKKEEQIKKIKEEESIDYSIRSEIMYKIIFKDWITTLHSLSWLLLILIVDIIAIMLKTFFPFGIYDNLVENSENKYNKMFIKWVEDSTNNTFDLNEILKKQDEKNTSTTKIVFGGIVLSSTLTIFGVIKYSSDILGFLNKWLEFVSKLSQ